MKFARPSKNAFLRIATGIVALVLCSVAIPVRLPPDASPMLAIVAAIAGSAIGMRYDPILYVSIFAFFLLRSRPIWLLPLSAVLVLMRKALTWEWHNTLGIALDRRIAMAIFEIGLLALIGLLVWLLATVVAKLFVRGSVQA
jgi:hypothetical protein